jgi:hypothetical protein
MLDSPLSPQVDSAMRFQRSRSPRWAASAAAGPKLQQLGNKELEFVAKKAG